VTREIARRPSSRPSIGDGMSVLPGREDFCDDGEHEWERGEAREWNTEYEDLNKRYHTVEYECVNCSARKWVKEEKTRERSVFDW